VAVAHVCVEALRVARGDEEQGRRVEEWLNAAAARHPALTRLQVYLADLYDLQGRYRDAEAAYRKILEQDGRNFVALNNLAWLLTLKGGRAAEALELVGRAVAVAGEVPALRDTRALVRLSQGEPEKAVLDLREALARAPTAARYFHLARAHQAADDRAAAADALRRAEAAGLGVRTLHPLERAAYHELVDWVRGGPAVARARP
jgi:tetratricopeptide (TPR) repeat protein